MPRSPLGSRGLVADFRVHLYGEPVSDAIRSLGPILLTMPALYPSPDRLGNHLPLCETNHQLCSTRPRVHALLGHAGGMYNDEGVSARIRHFASDLGTAGSVAVVCMLDDHLRYNLRISRYQGRYAGRDSVRGDPTQEPHQAVSLRHVTDANGISRPDRSDDRCWTSLLHRRLGHSGTAFSDGGGSGRWKSFVVLVVVQIRGTARGRKRVPELVGRVSEEVIAG